MTDLKFRGWYEPLKLMFEAKELIFDENGAKTLVPNVGMVKCKKFSENFDINEREVILMQKCFGQDFYEGDILSWFKAGNPYIGASDEREEYVVRILESKFSFFALGERDDYDADDTDFDSVLWNVFERIGQNDSGFEGFEPITKDSEETLINYELSLAKSEDSDSRWVVF